MAEEMQSKMKLAFNNRVLAGFACVVAVLVSFGIIAYPMVGQMSRSGSEVEHTYQVLKAVADSKVALYELESAARGYALSGQVRFLNNFKNVEKQNISGALRLQQLTRNNPAQQTQVKSLQALVKIRLNQIHELVQASGSRGLVAAANIARTGKGKQVTDAIRTVLGEIEGQERKRLEQKNQAARASSTRIVYLFFVGVGLVSVLMGAIYYLIRRDINRRSCAEQHLKVQYETARILSSSAGLEQAAAPVLQLVCETLGWQMGELWALEAPVQVMRFVAGWHRLPGWEVNAFETEARQLTFSRGVGLPGRVWQTASPVWVDEVTRYPDFRRTAAAEAARLHTALAVPLVGSSGVLGVLILFNRRVRKPDASLLSMAATIGDQLGQFVERKRSETALRESEQRFRLFVEQAPDALIMCDLQGRILDVNQRACDSLGYRRSELLKQLLSDIEQDLCAEPITLATRLSAGVPTTFDGCHRRKDGTTFPVEVRLSLFEAQQQQFVLALAHDITERERAATALRASESVLRSFYDSTTMLMGVVEVFGDDILLLSANAATARFLGLEPEQLHNRFAGQLGTSGMYLSEWLHYYRESEEGGRPMRFEYQRETGSGLLWLAVTVSFIARSAGGPARFSYLVEDVTERKQVEDQSQQTRIFLQTMIDYLPVAVFVKEGRADRFGVFKLWNKTSEKLFGLTAEQALGKTVYDYLPKDQADSFTEKDRRSFAGGQLEEIPVEPVESLSLGPRLLHTFRVPVLDESGKPEYLLCISEDITERKQAEQALHTSEAALKRELQRTLLLKQITEQVRFSLDTTEIFQTTAREIGQAFSVDRCIIHSYCPDPPVRAPFVSEYLANGFPSIMHLEIPVVGNAHMERILSCEEAHAIPDVFSEPLLEIVAPLCREIDLKSMLAVRTSYQGRPNGIIGLHQCSAFRDWTGEEIELLEAVAAQVGLALAQAHLLEQETQQRERLTWQADHDPLTGLLNRRAFERALDSALQASRQDGARHTLCYLDLDQFKIVNDTCGHVAGDELLVQLSVLLQANTRTGDTLARLGGDEFGLLLRGCVIEDAKVVTEALLDCVRRFRFSWSENNFTVGVSIGGVAIDEDTPSLTGVLSAADASCSAAKNAGRNRVCFWKADDEELRRQRGQMRWVSRIHRAIEHNQFCLYYQSIVSTARHPRPGEHYEVLLRLHNGEGEVISPMAFIPAAERYNLMKLIDRWVIQTLFTTQAEHYRYNWQYAKHREYLYCVNLSGASINDDEFISFIHEQFQIHQIPPPLICFEITETLAIANLSKASRLIGALKDLGCHFALDDFGSGASSFNYLKNLPVDYLKIDGSFIKDLVHDPIDRAIVESITKVARLMNVKTIAEYVENDQIFEQVRELGIDYAQGYGIAHPKPLMQPVILPQGRP